MDSGERPSVAVLIETQSIDRMHRVFYGFGNGILTQASANVGTDTNADTMATDALTYQALATKEFGDKPVAFYSDVSEGWDELKMKNQVFAGYTDPKS